VVETASVASAILAADSALKQATVDLLELRVANGLGGRSYLSLTGEVSDVRSSVLAGSKSAESAGMLLRQVVVPRPHPDLVRHL
jgi:microcompartment protein CcmL/EutN